MSPAFCLLHRYILQECVTSIALTGGAPYTQVGHVLCSLYSSVFYVNLLHFMRINFSVYDVYMSVAYIAYV